MTMNECPDGSLRDLLPLFVSGVLSAPDRSRVASHIAGCTDCAAEVELLGAVCRAYAVKPVNVAAISAKITPQRRANRMQVPFHRQPLWRIAAGMTLFIAGTATVLVVRGRVPEASPAAVAQGAPGAPGAPGAGGTGTAAETTIASSTAMVRATSNVLLSLGTELSEFSDSQLQSLLGSLDGLDSRPQADPTTIASPIIQERTQAPGRSNQ